MWREGKTLGDKIELERARVCQDPKGRVLAVDHRHWLYCGDAQTLPAVNPDMSSVFEPRQPGDKASATFNEKAQKCDVANPHQREPHALLRDDRGVYYFVDRGRTEGAEKNFRLWVGPKGAMVLQKMTNVVSDSAGDIVSTKFRGAAAAHRSREELGVDFTEEAAAAALPRPR